MDFDFESLYSLVETMNKSTKEKCLICHFPIDNDELVLTCNHYYHSKCLNKKTNNIKCPYCEKSVKIKKSDIKPIKNTIPNGCKVLLTTGARKGEYCGRNKCPYHKLNKEKVVVINPIQTCQHVLKSGPRKGQLCNKNNCKTHNLVI